MSCSSLASQSLIRDPLSCSYDEMCNLIMIYAVDGEELNPTPDIYTVRAIDADLFQQSVASWRIIRT